MHRAAVTWADLRYVGGRCGKPVPVPIQVKRHRGEPGHTRDRHTNRTNRTPSKPTHPPPRARQTTPKPRQSTPKPRDARVATNRTGTRLHAVRRAFYNLVNIRIGGGGRGRDKRAGRLGWRRLHDSTGAEIETALCNLESLPTLVKSLGMDTRKFVGPSLAATRRGVLGNSETRNLELGSPSA